jgi:uncharacterized repeat protein (TIGR03803 family)
MDSEFQNSTVVYDLMQSVLTMNSPFARISGVSPLVSEYKHRGRCRLRLMLILLSLLLGSCGGGTGGSSGAPPGPTLMSIAVTPAIPTSYVGTSVQFHAVGSYSDGSTSDMTATVTWNSATASVATISNASGSPGLATSLASGSTTITASSGESITSPGVTLNILSPAYSNFYSFTGGSDGSQPTSLIQGSDGNFYGTTASGGATNNGVVFKLTPGATTLTVLYSFAGGTDPASTNGITLASDGTLYGTSQFGGANNGGMVYTVTPDGVEKVLFSFPGESGIAPDSGITYNYSGGPASALIEGSDGSLYGATIALAGPYISTVNYGTVFRITPAGAETVLYSFTGNSDGSNPTGVIQGSDGNFYGATESVGDAGPFTVFKVTPMGDETVLYTFPSSPGATGVPPLPSALIQGTDGNFYGTTKGGGATGNGTVFKITPAGETTLYSFTGGSDGGYPTSLIQGSDGNFYGFASGIVNLELFVVTPAGVETVLVTFSSGNPISTPASLLQGSDGHMYGILNGESTASSADGAVPGAVIRF